MNEVKIIKKSDYQNDIRRIFLDLDFKINQSERILIKPNFVLPRSSDSGATTNLELISALIEFIKKNGAIPILGEGAGYEFDSQTFKILGVDKLAEKYGVEFIDFRNCPSFIKKTNNSFFPQIELPAILEKVDKIINVPKLKTHMLTRISCGMKNLMGILPLKERKRIHFKGLNRGIVELSLVIPVDLTIIDASIIMHGCGPAFGDKIEAGYLLASKNIFAVDFAAARLLNVDFRDIGYLKIAQERNLIPQGAAGKQMNSNLSAKIPKNKLYVFIYWLVYFFDFLQEKITGKTLIPWLHWRFGVRPKLDIKKCQKFNDCRKCIEICPVKAINKETGIDIKECAKVRCLKCFESCPYGAITIKGISKPTKKNG